MESTQYPLLMLLFFALTWIVLIIVVTRYGRKRKLGLGWTFVITLLLSPLIGFIAALASGKKESEDANVVI